MFKQYDVVCLKKNVKQSGLVFPAGVPMAIVEVYTNPPGYTLDCEELREIVNVDPDMVVPCPPELLGADLNYRAVEEANRKRKRKRP